MADITGAEISRTALDLKIAYLGLLVAAQLTVLPGQPLLAAWRSIWPHIPDPTLKLSAPDGSNQQYRVAQVLHELSTLGYGSMDSTVLTSAQVATAVSLGDLVVKSDRYDTTDPCTSSCGITAMAARTATAGTCRPTPSRPQRSSWTSSLTTR